jgi:hypothetical protein
MISWNVTYGGTGSDGGYEVIESIGGGYLVAGYSNSFSSGDLDVYVVNLDGDGNLIWEKTCGREGDDVASSIVMDESGDILVAGYMESEWAERDAYLIKMDSRGNILWQSVYGGYDYDGAEDIIPAGNGDFILVGYSDSFGEEEYDVWVLRIDGNGDLLWNRTFGGWNIDMGRAVAATADGGFIVVGDSSSFSEDDTDIYVLKVDGSGELVWDMTYGIYGSEIASDIIALEGGNYLISATRSLERRGGDICLLRINGNGELLWNISLEDEQEDTVNSVAVLEGGGFVLVGQSFSWEEEGLDLLIAVIDMDGEVLWIKRFQGMVSATANSVIQDTLGNVVIAGRTGRRTDLNVIKIEKSAIIGEVLPLFWVLWLAPLAYYRRRNIA